MRKVPVYLCDLVRLVDEVVVGYEQYNHHTNNLLIMLIIIVIMKLINTILTMNIFQVYYIFI